MERISGDLDWTKGMLFFPFGCDSIVVVFFFLV